MRVPGWAGVLGLALVFSAACASRVPRSSQGLAGRFVTPATEDVAAQATFDVAPVRGNGPPSNAEVEAVPVVPIPKVSPGPTLESENLVLKTALASLAVRESVAAHKLAAAAYWDVRIFDQAARHLSQAIRLQPRDARLFEERARLWRDAGALDRALSDAHRAIHLAPGLAEAQNTLGIVLYALGNVDAAGQRFARAVALSPGAAFAQSNLCFAALAGGALEQALMACDEALRIAPDFQAAQRNREQVEAALRALKDQKP